MGPTKGRLFKFDFPSAKFWVKIFFGWVGLRAKRPPPFINKVYPTPDSPKRVLRAPFNNSAPLAGVGGGGPTPPIHPLLKRLGQIFFPAFSRSKIFSGALGAN